MSRKTKLELTSGDESRHRRRIVDRLNWAVSLWNQLLDKLTIGGPTEPINFCDTLYIDCANKRIGIDGPPVGGSPDRLHIRNLENPGWLRVRLETTGADSTCQLNLKNDAQEWAFYLRGPTDTLVLWDLAFNKPCLVIEPNGIARELVLKTSGAVFNEDGLDYDFRVEGNTDANLLFCDAGNDRVGISNPTPTEKLDIDGDAIRLRQSSTPASASATGAVGEIRWDSNYVYVCVAANTWKRAALSTW